MKKIRGSNKDWKWYLPLLFISFFFWTCTFGGDLESLRPEPKNTASFTVTFIANGGTSAPAPQNVKQGGKANEPSAIGMTGYTLEGWYEGAGVTKWNFASDAVTEDITLTAKWTANSYTVEYKSNGGSGTTPASTHVYDEAKTLNPNAFTRSGFGFAGWAETAEGVVEFTDGQEVINLTAEAGGAVELFARWGGHAYHISYDSNGGDGYMENSTFTYGVPQLLRENAFSRVGYAFAGWAKTAGGAVEFTDTQSAVDLTATAGATFPLYAKWNPISYQVSYNKNAVDAVNTMANSSHVYDEEKNLNANAFTRTGYTFAGWSLSMDGEVKYDDGDSVKNLSSIAGAVVPLYAQWSRISYTVTFNSNGGTSVDSQQVYHGERAEQPANPTLAGYAFNGWCTSDNLNVLYNFDTPVTSATTMFARWTAAIVSFDKNGGNTEASPLTMTVPVPATSLGGLPTPPTREHYTFSGWNTEINGTGVAFTASMTIAGNTTVFAQWTGIPYTVTFDKNDGDSEANPQTKTVTRPIETVNSLPISPSREHYTFTGWNTQADGLGTSFTEATIVTENTTIFAQWTGVTYSVTFDKNSGTTEASPKTLDVTRPTITVGTLPIPPTWMGWIFAGWNTMVNGSGTAFTENTTVTTNITVYAQWIALEMVLISKGNFTMGSSDTLDNGASPPHQVTLSNDFYMSKYQVTQEQYQAVLGVNPSYFTIANGRSPATGETDACRPVEYVTWYDAVEFCNKLSVMEGLTPVYTIIDRSPISGYPIISAAVTVDWNANGYRLPTEAEWEYTCRAGTMTTGDNGLLDNSWYSANSGSRTHEVGKKQVNAWGLYDMRGNVSEWCWDWYENYTSGDQTDPKGPANGSIRVIRGGNWNSHSMYLRSAYRSGYNPGNSGAYYGFRLVRP